MKNQVKSIKTIRKIILFLFLGKIFELFDYYLMNIGKHTNFQIIGKEVKIYVFT